MTQWPEPAPEPGEAARRWRIGALAAVGALVLWAALRSDGLRHFSWRMPEINLPNAAMPDLRGRQNAPVNEPETPENEAVERITDPIAPLIGDGARSVQSVPFETCSVMLDDFPATLGQPALIVEDSADRRVRRYKFLDGNLTLTCARADNTLTIERGN